VIPKAFSKLAALFPPMSSLRGVLKNPAVPLTLFDPENEGP
jgi:hypothetical protein